MILGGNAVYCFTGADSIRIVGVRNRIRSLGYIRQPSPVLPGEGVAVTVGEGIADLVIQDS